MLRDQVRIEEKGFNLVSVEGDWPDCYRVNRYVNEYPGAGGKRAGCFACFQTLANLDVGKLGDRDVL